MKIAILSDIHVDITFSDIGVAITPFIIEALNEEKPDILIIAGDISDFSYQSIRILEDIERSTGIKVYFIPGNHDIWDDTDSWQNYNLFKEHSTSLIDNPVELDDNYVIIGDMGWYDYSFRPDYMTKKLVHQEILRTNEGQFTKWGMTPPKMTETMLKKFKLYLDKYKDKKVIFVNHFIPYSEYIITKDKENYNWNLINGMMGSESMGALLDTYSNIEYVIFGHTHFRFGINKLNGKTIICNPLGFAQEWMSKYSSEDFANNLDRIIRTEIKDSLTIINI